MTKLLILSKALELPGGVSNYIKILNKHLDKEKFEIKHLFVGGTGLIWKDLFYPLLIIIQLINLKKVLKGFQPELVHINPSLTNVAIIRDFLFLKIIKKEGCPVLFLIHGWRENISDKFQNIFWKNFFKKRLEMADAIVVLAYKFKKKLVDLGIDADKIYVSSTMVESEKYLPDSKNFTKPYNILFCANIIKEKGPFEFLKAAPMVLIKFPNTKFIFIGTGKDLKKLKEKSKKIGIEKNVVFTGYMVGKELIEIFKNAHLFVLPSYTEGFPTVVLEAMAAGASLIFTPVGGLSYALVDGKNGYVINSMPPKPEEISEKIIKLIENKKLMKNMSENNLKKAKEKFDGKIVSKQIEEIYQNIIN